MSDIRTPEDEVDRPGWFLPPFRESWWYQGSTYAGHSNGAVDWNRRTKTGGWLDDTGDPVFAIADGRVTVVDPYNGLVTIEHSSGYSSDYRHMTGPFPKVGQKVQRGDRVGSIGDVAGDGRSIGAHLHHVQYRHGKPIVQSFYGKPIAVSVLDSDTRPAAWKAPDPVMVQGPPPRATWESAFREALAQRDALKVTADEAADIIGGLKDDLAKAQADLAACEARTPADCTAVEDEAARLRDVLDRVKALVTL